MMIARYEDRWEAEVQVLEQAGLQTTPTNRSCPRRQQSPDGRWPPVKPLAAPSNETAAGASTRRPPNVKIHIITDVAGKRMFNAAGS
jgi:hypothetical protein